MIYRFSKRFSDKFKKQLASSDFIRRKISPTPLQVGILYSTIICIFIFIFLNISYFGLGISTTLSTLILISLGFFFILMLERAYDLVMANEFQNAIFAGSAGAGAEFSIIVRNDNTVIYCNPGYYKYFAYTIKGGHTDLDALFKNSKLSRENIERMMAAMAKNRQEKFEVDMTTLEGETRRLILKLEPIKRPKGYFSLKAIRLDADNLTGGIENKDENYSEGLIPDVLNSVEASFYILNSNNIVQHANDLFGEIFGYDKEELKNNLDFSGLTFSLNKSLYNLDKSFQGVLTFQDKEHKMFEAKINHFVNKNSDGEITRKYGIIIPVIDNKLNIAPVEKDKGPSVGESWNRLIENSPVPKMILDEQGIVQRSNEAARLLLGKKSGQVSGWNLAEAINPENREEFHALLSDAVKSDIKSSKSISVRLNGENNNTATLYLSKFASRQNERASYVCDLIDTTEQKNLELRFVHSQKMQAVGQLAGGIAHDFNNLLTAMTGFCDLLLIRHPSGDPSFADIMQIKQNANRAANLVRQLLAFSRKQTLHPEVLEITDILAELSNLVRRLIGENIELKMIHGRNLGLVKVDQGQFEQVIINLAVNARDAMTNGGILTIQTSNVTIDKEHPLQKDLIPPAEDEIITEGNYILIEVIDSGTGIPPAILGKIFEPFFSTKEVGQGTGLGLSTVYGIVKQTGGFIYVTSEIGKGTKFSIFLKSQPASEERPVKSEEADKAITRDLTGVETILLVEDEDPVRIFSARALRNKGYSVLEADCGEAALDIMDRMGNEINVIITDVVMPGINGPTMIEQVSKKYPNIKVIFISGYAEDAFLKTYGTERKFNFLPKPFTLKQLASKVKEVIDKDK